MKCLLCNLQAPVTKETSDGPRALRTRACATGHVFDTVELATQAMAAALSKQKSGRKAKSDRGEARRARAAFLISEIEKRYGKQTRKQIASDLGVSQTRITYIVQKLGIAKTPAESTRITRDRALEALKTASAAEVAETMGLAIGYVRRLANANNLNEPPRPPAVLKANTWFPT